LTTTLQLHHEHISNTSTMPLDARGDRSQPIAWEQFYFVGFRIDSPCGDRYHHTLILADSHDAFLGGIASKFLDLLNHEWISSGQDISVVFIQNLMLQNPSIVQKAGLKANRTKNVPVPPRNSNAFSVIGITENHQFCSLEVDSDNAIKAIEEANEQVSYVYSTRFKPLAITQINTAAIDFFNLLTNVVETVKELMGGAAKTQSYLH